MRITLATVLLMLCSVGFAESIPTAATDIIEACSSSKFETPEDAAGVVTLKIQNEFQVGCSASDHNCQLWMPVYFYFHAGASQPETVLAHQEFKDSKKIVIRFAGGYLKVGNNTEVNSRDEKLYRARLLVSHSRRHNNMVTVFCKMSRYGVKAN